MFILKKMKSFSLFILAAAGIALIAAGCISTQKVRYKNMPPVSISGKIQRDMKIGIAKFADLRSFVTISDPRSESYIDNNGKHALEFDGRDYYPVKDMIHKIFVDEFIKAGFNAKPIDAVLSKDKKKDMHIIGKKNGVDYIMAGDIADFKFDSADNNIHQRTVTLNIILLKVQGEETLFDATFTDINEEFNDDLDADENADRLANIPLRNVLKQVIRSTAAKLSPAPTASPAPTSSPTSTALTPEEILLLKKAGVADERILEIHKKGGAASPQPAPPPQPARTPPINAFDWNEDGKKDIITGSNSGQVYVYLNKGTNKEPMFDEALEIPNVKVGRGWSDPYVIDWYNDGRKDILAGSGPGEVSIFVNRGSNEQPIFEKERKFNDGYLDVGFSSSPAVIDWNGDGKKDLLIGNSRGDIYIFLNIGFNVSPQFLDDGIKTPISVSGYARPFIVDWNNDSKFDVVCGSSDGKVYIFVNEGDGKNPKFSKPLLLQVNNKEVALPAPTSVIALDWDDDGRTDLLVSNKEKNQLGMYLLLNTGTKEKPEFKELKPVKGKFKDDAVL